ncbi:MAG TPA: chromate transporter [Candidatus Avimonas sp.]|jgi:chromate transporter|nr:chromate transporter [Clostridiales bacterium]HOB36334.1 chromate transporter [Candidatus Avimonas sp.]HQA15827.1 chromate transporter [Candidatus Avimonas sp.]HQD37787.1 chromate transporter [Candidatus Avimonas sp.]
MIYLKLFWSFVQIGLFTIGGGYAAIPLIQNQVVNINEWMSLAEFTDLVTIAELTPGPIAINAATFVGTRMAGPFGSIVATIGCVLPSCVIVSILALLYKKYSSLNIVQGVLGGLRPAVVGMISSAWLSILALALLNGTTALFGLKTFNPYAACIFAASLFILKKFKISPIIIMLCSGLVGLVVYSI